MCDIEKVLSIVITILKLLTAIINLITTKQKHKTSRKGR
jgi:hypothetical protein